MVNRTLPTPTRDTEATAEPAAATDGELLVRFARHGDHDALEEVIERHRPMIWGVCSRVLVRRADAEDAYQATLLLLAKKAGSIRANDSAGGWLFRVAHNAALQAKRHRKALRETSLDEAPPAPETFLPDLEQKQLVAALLEELRSLPQQYQTPLVLRYLEGRSRREIAAQTEATVATVAGQLVRGRRMLRSRLARRGVSFAVALGAFGVGAAGHAATTATIHGGAPAFDPASVSTAFSSTTSAASAAVQQLVRHGTRSMLFASLTKPAALGLAASLVAALLLIEPPEGAAQSAAKVTPQLRITAKAPADIEANEPPRVQLAAPQTGFGRGRGGHVGGRSTENSRTTEPTLQSSSDAGPADTSVKRRLQTEGDVVFSPVAAKAPHPGPEEMKRRLIEAAAKDGITDYSQPSFQELYYQHMHWSVRRGQLEDQIRSFDARRHARAKALSNDGKLRETEIPSYDEKSRRVMAELVLAMAKTAEYERLMKQVAVAETRSETTQQRRPSANLAVRPFNNLLEERTVFPPARPSGQVPSGLLSAGDVILVDGTFPKNSVKLNERCIVEADGTIGLGAAIGRVKVGGLTMRQAEEAVQKHIDNDWDEVTIQLTPTQVPIPVYTPAQQAYWNDPPQIAFPRLPSHQGPPTPFPAAKPLPNQGFGVPAAPRLTPTIDRNQDQ